MVPKILVVDDEPQFERLVLQRFRRQLRAGAFEFVFANNGKTALQVLAEQPDIQAVLSDINMPEMDGLELITTIHAEYPMLRVVIVSAYGDMDNIRQAMNQGAFDFVTKPIDFANLEATIKKTLREVEVIHKAKEAEKLALKNEQLLELDQLKSELFTNIAHEFRTPLTVILGMADQIKTAPDDWLDKGVTMIRRNCGQLLHLVNELLELRQLEAGKLKLNAIHSNVVHYVKYIAESFRPMMESKDLMLHQLFSKDELLMDYDPERLLTILSNLLSNAIKYTPSGGHIYLQLDQATESKIQGEAARAYLKLSVKDSGIGIAEEDLPQLFERYFQADIGAEALESLGSGQLARSGVGLAFAAQLAQLMGGVIEVDSKLGEGSTFTLWVPIRKEQAQGEIKTSTKSLVKEIASYSSLEAVESVLTDSSSTSTDKPLLLLVEDNADIREYLISILSNNYQLQVAKDGEQGIEMALAQIPDAIISDVMMPKKDGLELCDSLKNNPLTSHIPILLLTAKADDLSRIEGLKRGADAYISKPFKAEELQIRLEQQLALRKRLQEYFSTKMLDSSSASNTQEDNPLFSNLEDSFIASFHQSLEENIEDENFGITEMCKAMAMSRAQLHRKIKALTGLSTSHYMRAIRLQKARQLLEKTDLNISEVSYRVGFKDPKYFSRTYSEVYGFAPTETPKV
ncbi:MAG: response regulator [Saprospiraceae bacterium]|nr:response regulator [Saprospiraceae bacterium]